MKKTTAKNKNLWRVGAVLLLSAFWIMIPFIFNDKSVSADELSDTRIQASLTGAPINGVNPAGFSEWRLDDSGRRRLEVRTSSVSLAAGTALTIVINNAAIGQFNVDGFGNAFFSIDTNNGQTVPVVNFGNPIQINNGATTILAGTYGTVTPTPSPSGSPTGSPNPSPSVSPSGSPNGTPSPSPTGSPNGTPSPTVSPTVSPTASPNGTPSPSPTASPNGTPSPSPSPSGGDLFAGLSGSTVNGVLPSGFAQYELHSSRTELEVRVYQVSLPGGTPLTVAVNNSAVGQIIMESGGEGRLRLRSDRGQNVPVITAGMTITVQNGGATILSGTFSGATASPSPSPSTSPSPGESPSPSPSPNASPSPSPSPALGRYFEVHPTGAQIDPPVTTNANAEFKVFLNAAETQATLTAEFHNLSSAQTGARIEVQIGSTAVVHDFGALGGTSGSFSAATINVSAIQVQQLRAGLWFAVITSANNPNGEVGGKFTQHSNGGDFDGDGSNDLAVFRPSSGTWFAQNSQGFSAQNFGLASDIPVSADYDGDGKTDRAVFRDNNGNAVWEINRSSDGGVTATQFGYSSDTPLRGDFDGDGRNDIAVYRPSEGVWYVQKSNGTGYQIVQFGIAEDIPLTTDMDGDGKADITVFRPSSGLWFWINSSTGSIGIVRFGATGDKPLKGDFDGDGRDDVAVYRPSTGVWYIWRSSDGSYDIRQFGIAEDIPVAGNYDGDNKTDRAVFRPSTGDWYIWRSVDNTYEFRHFGLTGDIPTVR